MRSLLTYILLILLPVMVTAQLHTLSNQYVLNGLAINPAFAGSDEAFSTTLMYRNQWTGFEGAPKTITAALHSPLRNELVGLGLLVVSDQIGVNSETSVMGNYAYMIETGKGKLSFGIGIGVSFLNVNWDELKSVDVNDVELNTDAVKMTNPNFSAGVYYYQDDFFLGVSIPFLLSYTYTGEDGQLLDLKNDFSEYNFHITSGYAFELNGDLKFAPSFLAKYHPGTSFQTDVSGQFIIRDRIWLGASYRSLDVLAFIAQIQVNDQLRVAYSYDTGLTKDSRYYGGSHEVMLKYVFNFDARVVGPRRF